MNAATVIQQAKLATALHCAAEIQQRQARWYCMADVVRQTIQKEHDRTGDENLIPALLMAENLLILMESNTTESTLLQTLESLRVDLVQQATEAGGEA